MKVEWTVNQLNGKQEKFSVSSDVYVAICGIRDKKIVQAIMMGLHPISAK